MALSTAIGLLLWTSHLISSSIFQTPVQSEHILLIAHRGGISPEAPENSLLAFNNAISQGAHVIEIDLRSTKDGEIVIMHDATVDRTTNGSGKVSDFTLQQLKNLDLGRSERIPTYEETLQFASQNSTILLLDIKEASEAAKQKIVELTEKFHSVLNVIIGVRNLADLKFFKTANHNFRLLGFVQNPEESALFVNAGVDIIRLWPKWIYKDPGLIDKIHSMGKPVWVTAGSIDKKELEQLIELGIDGVLLDRIEVATKFRAEELKNPPK
ncbi:MAG: glycerophosphodiester phosphodiesterase family protein [Deferribacteres bacterium]|nr:glycerophosphodiester phosphodiesterase family protein [Deferribacteres bacterium]